jgi:hypothetical protein
MIEYAELRIYRELDFIRTISEQDTTSLTIGTRQKAVPTGILIVNSASLITPANTAAALGTRNPLQRTSVEFINFFWPDTATLGVPSHYTMQDDQVMLLAPTPSAAYRVCVQGVSRPTPLSFGNQATFLTQFVPDLFVAASCIWGFGAILSNFGGASDNPEAANSWEQTYSSLRQGVDMENLRAKAWSMGWGPWTPSPMAKEARA